MLLPKARLDPFDILIVEQLGAPGLIVAVRMDAKPRLEPADALVDGRCGILDRFGFAGSELGHRAAYARKVVRRRKLSLDPDSTGFSSSSG